MPGLTDFMVTELNFSRVPLVVIRDFMSLNNFYGYMATVDDVHILRNSIRRSHKLRDESSVFLKATNWRLSTC